MKTLIASPDPEPRPPFLAVNGNGFSHSTVWNRTTGGSTAITAATHTLTGANFVIWTSR